MTGGGWNHYDNKYPAPYWMGFNSLNYANSPMNWMNLPTNMDQKNFLYQNNFLTQNLNGIWQAMSGDIMAIYNNNRFIWSDGKKRHLAGSFVITNQQMLVYINGQNQVVIFTFARQNNQFIVRDSKGTTHVFSKIY